MVWNVRFIILKSLDHMKKCDKYITNAKPQNTEGEFYPEIKISNQPRNVLVIVRLKHTSGN